MRLGTNRLLALASPGYLALPRPPAAPVRAHAPRLHRLRPRQRPPWVFMVDGRLESFALSFRLQANNGDVLAEAAAQGMGMIQPDFIAADCLRRPAGFWRPCSTPSPRRPERLRGAPEQPLHAPLVRLLISFVGEAGGGEADIARRWRREGRRMGQGVGLLTCSRHRMSGCYYSTRSPWASLAVRFCQTVRGTPGPKRALPKRSGKNAPTLIYPCHVLPRAAPRLPGVND